jgi:acetolactate synthase-1/2/3 large subunit
MIKLSDYVVKFIKNLGVKHIFLLPGGGCMHLVDSVGRCKEIEYVCNLHEQACAIAADAYAQYTNNLGVALVTTGPGGTNTLTGVAASWLESTPTLIISGQVKRADIAGKRGVRQMGFQEINIVEIVKSITKYAVTILDPDSIRYHLEKAIYLAKNGRPGPVWIDIPLDVQAIQIDDTKLKSFDPIELKSVIDENKIADQVSKVIDLLNKSERPVLLVGNGVRLAKAEVEIFEVIDLLNIPILATWKVIDYFPHEKSYYIGRPGAVAHRAANFAQQTSDFILTIGARLDLGQTGYSHQNFASNAHKVIVDIDENEINKLDMKIDVPIILDVKKFLIELIRQKDKIIRKDRKLWWNRCMQWKGKYPLMQKEYYDVESGINNYVFLKVLSECLNSKDVIIPGSSGACSEVTMQAFEVKAGMRVLNSNSLGPMGFAIPASIGGCLASGRRRTICIDGDGGFQMNIQELETIKRLNLPIKLFVLDNNGYGSIRSTQNNYFNGFLVASDSSCGLTFPKLAKIAEAYSIPFFDIKDSNDMKDKIGSVLNIDGPVICRVIVPSTQYTAPRVSSRQNPDGTMVSLPMEDLWPFLDRKEFTDNMMIKSPKE